ncbi:hypothetical protein LEP1GSC024_1117 [Leptospira noguchii str. 2001034031]|uniref:Uncharacterized protein n=1 Tax=Leptospira noguchii str. 2001034031 TaxID=1193053 RepID=M6YN80_9LEPT|nr:hypothetical protein LEP1GSC024_1117 [Leptospira noguchii str. 2001034031]
MGTITFDLKIYDNFFQALERIIKYKRVRKSYLKNTLNLFKMPMILRYF